MLNDNMISLVVPVYNEEGNLPELFRRIHSVMGNLGRPHELILINDGSKDSSLPLMLQEQKHHPHTIRVIDLNGNFGQHTAILAGFSIARGTHIITLDADLQNPPEEIPRLVAELDSGHDVVGTIRKKRKDSFFRRYASRLVNRIMNKVTGFTIHDYGCMLRGYSRGIIDIINECGEVSTFIPALAQKFAASPVEIEVSHSAREAGESKYSLFRLIRLQFDLMTAFSLFPLQAITITGGVVTGLGILAGIAGVFAGLGLGHAVNMILAGLAMTSTGITGEYVGRIYQEVRKRPRWVIRKIYEEDNDG
ncbi:MAG: glycosyltransferase [Synergistaceae bacterium]|nr:glycosyltransferase [Synergistaceae bacterium]